MTAPVYRFLPAIRLSVRFEGSDKGVPIITEADVAKALEKDPASTIGQEWFLQAPVVPLWFRLERNDFFEADELEFEVPWLAAPFDPRIVRAIQVELFGGLVTDDEFAEAMETGTLIGISTHEYYRRFLGYADDIELKVERRAGTIKILARDFQGIIEETPMRPRLAIGWGGDFPAGAIVGQILSAYPATKGIKVEPVGEAASMKVGAETARRKDADEMLWNYLQRRVVLSGLIPYMVDDTLYLATAGQVMGKLPFGWHALYGQDRNEHPDIAGTTVGPVFATGVNVEDPKISRQLSKRSAPPIKVVMKNMETGQEFSASYPPLEFREIYPERATTGSGDSAPRVVSVPYGKYGYSQLLEVAKVLYIMGTKPELKVEFTTKDFSSLGRTTEIADVLDLRPGDSIIYTDKVTASTYDGNGIPDSFSLLRGMELNELIKHLHSVVGYDPDVATRLAKYLKGDLPDTFKLRKMTVDWSGESATHSIKIEAAEYMAAIINPGGWDLKQARAENPIA